MGIIWPSLVGFFSGLLAHQSAPIVRRIEKSRGAWGRFLGNGTGVLSTLPAFLMFVLFFGEAMPDFDSDTEQTKKERGLVRAALSFLGAFAFVASGVLAGYLFDGAWVEK